MDNFGGTIVRQTRSPSGEYRFTDRGPETASRRTFDDPSVPGLPIITAVLYVGLADTRVRGLRGFLVRGATLCARTLQGGWEGGFPGFAITQAGGVASPREPHKRSVSLFSCRSGRSFAVRSRVVVSSSFRKLVKERSAAACCVGGLAARDALLPARESLIVYEAGDADSGGPQHPVPIVPASAGPNEKDAHLFS